MAVRVPPTLVLAAQGSTLRAWVTERAADGAVTVDAQAVATGAERAAALAEVLERLRAVTRVPRRCVLLSAEVTLALLPLPLVSGRPRPFEQMSQLVRWELEPYFARHGVVDEAETYVCGWAPAGGADEAERPLWWVSGISRGRRAGWNALLGQHGLVAVGYLPLVGAGGALPMEDDVAVIEAADDRVAVTLVRDGAPRAFEEILVEPGQDLAGACREAREQAADLPVRLTGPAADAALAGAVGAGGERLPDVFLRGALGSAGRHAGVACIPRKDRRPPLVRRAGLWWAAAVLLPVAAIVGSDHRLAADREEARVALEEARREAAVLQDARRREEARGEAIRGLETQLLAARERRAALRERLASFGGALARRRAFLPALLDALAEAVTEEVVLRRITEPCPGTVRVEGWALTEPAVQLFTRELAVRVRSLDLHVHDHEMRAAEGPYRREGFAFAFDLVPPLPSGGTGE